MNCDQLRAHYHEVLDQGGTRPTEAAAWAHLRQCRRCGVWADQQLALMRSLREVPAPPPLGQQRAMGMLRQAEAEHRRKRMPVMAAATFAAAVLVGVLGGFMWQTQIGPAAPEATVVTMEPGQQKPVELVFRANERLKDVRLSLALPDNAELVGYEGQRQLSWRTDLKPGENYLRLPIRLTGSGSGELVARLERGGQKREFRVSLRAAGADSEVNGNGS